MAMLNNQRVIKSLQTSHTPDHSRADVPQHWSELSDLTEWE